uniref:Uncharacterized protein n=1 Tax=Oryza meridionalis TaxID=40149 RepID=A0A0E0CJJ1_9ORYZ
MAQQQVLIPLTQYVMMAQTLMMHINENLFGKNSAMKFHVLTEEAKRLIRTILKQLYFFHRNGQCPEKFTESNVFVTISGRAKLVGVKLGDKNDTMVFQNYQDAHRIIVETVFQKRWKEIPADMMHLLRLMRSRATAIHMGYVICTHASLVPLENRESFFMKMYKHIMHVLPRDKPTAHRNILQALPYDLDWYNKLQGNDLLEELFSSNKGGYGNGSTEFLRFYRNATVHDMDHYYKRRYTPNEFQLILAVTYPLLLPRMQEELEKEKHLRILRLDSLL